VGNEIQTDSVAFDFEFYAVQSRHNDGSANPCITSREVEGFGKQDYEPDADVLWASKARNGGSNTFELIVGDDNSNADTADYDFGGSSFDGDLTVAYDADTGEATRTRQRYHHRRQLRRQQRRRRRDLYRRARQRREPPRERLERPGQRDGPNWSRRSRGGRQRDRLS